MERIDTEYQAMSYDNSSEWASVSSILLVPIFFLFAVYVSSPKQDSHLPEGRTGIYDNNGLPRVLHVDGQVLINIRGEIVRFKNDPQELKQFTPTGIHHNEWRILEAAEIHCSVTTPGVNTFTWNTAIKHYGVPEPEKAKKIRGKATNEWSPDFQRIHDQANELWESAALKAGKYQAVGWETYKSMKKVQILLSPDGLAKIVDTRWQDSSYSADSQLFPVGVFPKQKEYQHSFCKK